MGNRLTVAVLEPYYGGSHAAFVDTLAQHSRHELVVSTLPARKWKWRMRGASMWFAREATDWLNRLSDVDVVLCSDMLSVADLRAFLPPGRRDIPVVCYFHENQLTYPIPADRTRDFQYGMTNISSCLAADAVWFNSRFHLENFLAAAEALLRKMPDYVPDGLVHEIRRKAKVISPPVDIGSTVVPAKKIDGAATILWSHRWEFDKNPEPFFDALIRLDQEGYSFDLVLLGESFRTAPPVFASSWDRLASHITHARYLPSRTDYLAMLARCDFVVSTAIQENFGIAVIEAVLAGCQPLLPNRLAYPEIIPGEFHESCLYPSDADLYRRLRDCLDGRGCLGAESLERLRTSMNLRYGVDPVVLALDHGLEQVAAGRS